MHLPGDALLITTRRECGGPNPMLQGGGSGVRVTSRAIRKYPLFGRTGYSDVTVLAINSCKRAMGAANASTSSSNRWWAEAVGWPSEPRTWA